MDGQGQLGICAGDQAYQCPFGDLGGPDYNKIERHNQLAEQGKGQDDSMGLQGSSGYRYFGIAKDLPGVKELFARNAVKVTKKKRGEV